MAEYKDMEEDLFDSEDSDTESVESIIHSSCKKRQIIESSESDEEADTSNELQWTEVSAEDGEPNIPFLEYPGVRHIPSTATTPIDYFNLFFTTSLFQLFVTETNRYARTFLEKYKTEEQIPKDLRNFVNTTIDEMKVFIGCILNMGLLKKPTIISYWTTTNSQRTPWFNEMMPRKRFQILLKFFHMVDDHHLGGPGTTDYDPCRKFQPIVDHANKISRHYYVPNKELSVDESLVGTKNHTSLMQYLPNKHHHKWGIKLWMICDSVVNYCLGFFVYKGAKSQEDKQEIKDKGLGYIVVLKLMKMGNYLNKGYHVFIDNFFNSIPLVRDLYRLQTYVTGTVRKNRKFLPEYFRKKFFVGELKYFRNNEILALAYRQKKSQNKPVLLLSSHASARNQKVTTIYHGSERTVEKPEVITQYNKYMGGVDTSDQMLYTYLDERRTVKYWKKVTFNIISRMVLNCYILYKGNPCNKKLTRYEFTVNIIEKLGENWVKFRNLSPSTINSSSIRCIQKLPERKEKNCVVCSTKTHRSRSRTACSKCNKGVHGKCFHRHLCEKASL